MGGRGHGRGSSMLFAAEQLGVGRGEAVPAVAAPLPDYPPLEQHPAPLPVGRPADNAALRHRVALTSSMAGLRLALAPSAEAPLPVLDFDWSYFPLELRPAKRRARQAPSTSTTSASHRPAKVARSNNINALLDALEQAETVEVKTEPKEDDKEGENEEEDGEQGGEGRVAEEEEEDVDMDDEMDEGTDYNMNYFDNGENYLDEDDDGDDGPIY